MFNIFWPYLSFASDKLFIFSGFVKVLGMMQVNQKSAVNLFLKIHESSSKLQKI